jgi:DNA replication protein DnaC
MIDRGAYADGSGLFLLVLGSLGVGKSYLAFLFLRVLLELGTKVVLFFCF